VLKELYKDLEDIDEDFLAWQKGYLTRNKTKPTPTANPDSNRRPNPEVQPWQMNTSSVDVERKGRSGRPTPVGAPRRSMVGIGRRYFVDAGRNSPAAVAGRSSWDGGGEMYNSQGVGRKSTVVGRGVVRRGYGASGSEMYRDESSITTRTISDLGSSVARETHPLERIDTNANPKTKNKGNPNPINKFFYKACAVVGNRIFSIYDGKKEFVAGWPIRQKFPEELDKDDRYYAEFVFSTVKAAKLEEFPPESALLNTPRVVLRCLATGRFKEYENGCIWVENFSPKGIEQWYSN